MIYFRYRGTKVLWITTVFSLIEASGAKAGVRGEGGGLLFFPSSASNFEISYQWHISDQIKGFYWKRFSIRENTVVKMENNLNIVHKLNVWLISERRSEGVQSGNGACLRCLAVFIHNAISCSLQKNNMAHLLILLLLHKARNHHHKIHSTGNSCNVIIIYLIMYV